VTNASASTCWLNNSTAKANPAFLGIEDSDDIFIMTKLLDEKIID